MAMIINYQVVESVELGNLEAEVKKQIKYGWEPYEGLVVLIKQGTIPKTFYHQVMVKRSTSVREKLT